MSRVSLQRTTPILRIFDERKAGEFHVQFLGFAIDWEHRFEPGSLLHMQVSRGRDASRSRSGDVARVVRTCSPLTRLGATVTATSAD